MLRSAVVDGATGFVGANLAASLLSDGASVSLLSRQHGPATRQKVRSASIVSASASSALPFDLSSTEVVPFALDQPDLGLDDAQLARLFSSPCEFWHVAANVNFRAGNRDEVIDTNVGGTASTLAAFERYAAPGSRYLFVSTAYCCGYAVDQPVERWYETAPPSVFRNYYEYSKRQAELLVRSAIDRGVDAAVLRLGQVVGDSRTGHAETDYGMYNLIRSMWSVARRRPNEHLRIEAHDAATLHLVPIDATVRWMRAVASSELSDVNEPIFHIVDRRPVAGAEMIVALSKWLPLKISVASPTDFQKSPPTQLDRVVAARLAYTGSYLEQPFLFGRENLDRLTKNERQVTTPEALDRIVGALVDELRL